jgi:4-amino-4-deoxy-L-arabinose transferase-like glycosyltransferase
MFRFNNPDSLLVLLLVAAAYGVCRSVEGGRTSWLLLAGACVGLGFLTKSLQALIIVPVLAGTYLTCGPGGWGRRLLQLAGAGCALAVAAGWWIAIVQLTPAADRPYIGGSQDNSLWNLTLGYNGLGRLSGHETGSLGFASASSGGGGGVGLARMLNGQFGDQISWFLPAALLAIVVGLWVSRHGGRNDMRRALVLLFGGSLVLTGLVFSFSGGIIHTYYSVALAPAIAGLAAIGSSMLWQRRGERWAQRTLAAGGAGTVVWSAHLLAKGVIVGTLVLIVLAGLVALVVTRRPRRRGRSAGAWAAVGLVLALVGPAGFCLGTILTAQHTDVPTAGFTERGSAAGGDVGDNPMLLPAIPDARLTALASGAPPSATWAIATIGSDVAAGYQLATGRPAMAIGGFNATDPVPTLAAFQAEAQAGRVGWFVDDTPGGRTRFGAVGANAVAIDQWVERSFTPVRVDGAVLYRLAPSHP